MDVLVTIAGKTYLMKQPQAPYMPPLTMIEPAPAKLFVGPLFYGPPIAEASLVKEDRSEEIADLGRLILNGAELAERKAAAEHRAAN